MQSSLRPKQGTHTTQSAHAQGTIEYLIIVAIVVVIALVLVSLLMGITSNTSDVSLQSSKAYWTIKTPVAVSDGRIGQDGNLILVLKNTSSGPITIPSSGIEVGGTTVTLSDDVTIPAFSEATVTTETEFTGTQGDLFSQDLKITYTVDTYGITKTIGGDHEFVLQYSY